MLAEKAIHFTADEACVSLGLSSNVNLFVPFVDTVMARVPPALWRALLVYQWPCHFDRHHPLVVLFGGEHAEGNGCFFQA